MALGRVKNMPKQRKEHLRKDGQREGRFFKKQADGKARYGYVFSRTCEEKKRKLKAAFSENMVSTSIHDRSFDRVANEWLLLQVPQPKTSSIAKYTNKLNLYLLPNWGNQRISNISLSNRGCKVTMVGTKDSQQRFFIDGKYPRVCKKGKEHPDRRYQRHIC